MLAGALGKRKMKVSAGSIAAGLEEAGVEVWGDLRVLTPDMMVRIAQMRELDAQQVRGFMLAS